MSYLSNQTKVREFIDGPVWQDMVAEVAEWKKDVENQYPGCETLKELGTVNGRLEALAYFLALPHVMLSNLEEIARLRKEGVVAGDEEPDGEDDAEAEYLSDMPD